MIHSAKPQSQWFSLGYEIFRTDGQTTGRDCGFVSWINKYSKFKMTHQASSIVDH